MFSRRTFVAKFGDPMEFLFKGQVWDSRLPDATSGTKNCGICRRHIRFVFILKHIQTVDPLKNPETGKLEIGRCCFHYFRNWNPNLFEALYHTLEYEKNREKAIRRDKKVFGEWVATKVKAKMWRSLRRQGFTRLKTLQRKNASAPVGTVMQLMNATNRQPDKKRAKWYERQIQELRQTIGDLS